MTLNTRIWEIDFLRGLAIILMVLFHLIVDLRDFFGYAIEYLTGFWFYVGKLSAIMFISTAGISATLSRNTLKHGLQIFLWGMVLTVITYFYNPLTYIRFGILHLLGFSIVSYHLIAWLRPVRLFVAALMLMIIGCLLVPLPTTSPYLFPLGFVTATFASLDYYPIVPWYGVFLLGVAVGKVVYSMKKSRFHRPFFTPISRLGQHSLMIYLVHQPILLVMLNVCSSVIK